MNNWADFERFATMIESASFRFAKTMPNNPHHYTLRKDWVSNDFDWAVNFLRDNGYKARYRGWPYIQIDVNEHFYWTMGAPVKDTILINRKVKVYETPYNKIGQVYDTLFCDDDSKVEDQLVMDIIGDTSGLSILDVGCGTGLFLDYNKPESYTGIDISSGMLAQLKHKHPTARVINAPLSAFSGGRYDLVIALFGSASYLSMVEVLRLPLLAKKKGRVVAMFYDSDYYPYTYKATGIQAKYTPYQGQLVGELTKINNMILVDIKL